MKKNAEHLESRRPSILLVGLMASLALTLVAFEWTAYNHENHDYVDLSEMTDWDEVTPVHTIKVDQPKKAENRKARSPILKIGDPNQEVKGKVDFSLKSVLTGLDMGGDEDYGDPLETGFGTETVDWALLGNKPHYADCENIVDREAQSKCTEASVISFVAKNTKFPSQLRGMNETVYVNFVIDIDGSITDVEPLDVEPLRNAHPLFEKAAIKAVKKLPKMVPGEQLGKPVRVRFLIPVRFTTTP